MNDQWPAFCGKQLPNKNLQENMKMSFPLLHLHQNIFVCGLHECGKQNKIFVQTQGRDAAFAIW